MKFLQKRWVAVVICVILVITALGIRAGRNIDTQYRTNSEAAAENWGEQNYGAFTQFILDEADELSQRTVKELSVYNAAFDYAYDSICGVAIVEGTDGMSMEDKAYDLSAELGLGDSDCLLLVDQTAGDWYFVYGADFSYYVNNELEVIFTQYMQKGVESPNTVLPELFEELEDWYDDHVPVQGKQTVSVVGGIGSVLLIILFIVILVIVSIVSSVGRIGRRFVGGWGPTFFVGGRHHHRPNPGPGPGNFHRPTGRSGGFGGSSRGSGFRGGGGFGGSSRGGGFGGRR